MKTSWLFGTPAEENALATTSFKAWCRDALPGVCLQTKLWVPWALLLLLLSSSSLSLLSLLSRGQLQCGAGARGRNNKQFMARS